MSSKSGVALLFSSTATPEHERQTFQAVGTRIARLLEVPYQGIFADTASSGALPYFVPSDTLVGVSNYEKLAIRNESDFFGGLVAQPFMGTKAISHPLHRSATYQPEGWADRFHSIAADAVLPGYTAFCIKDALAAGAEMLQAGPIRLKPVLARAGKGQSVITSLTELKGFMDQINETELAIWGLVLEENLTDVITYSVGQVRLCGVVGSYCGTQRLTRDNTGQLVYGGSDLRVVRGDYPELQKLGLSSAFKLAVERAQQYERAALESLPGIVLSRRNYDVAEGTNQRGERVTGVLEQSWRIGGASSAEVLAIEMLSADPSLAQVQTSTLEIYGEDAELPADATVVYSGEDSEVGYLTKCVKANHDS
ncbi:DUF3182 family protein [Pseudomonas sp. OIL-1]|uniref:DUF3182 family protein n=1 Tax=Pseudomonas sp. OIL-1 TaxID=2706126 RepID=UPI0013A77C07|nr:DUF3182 family protein [Pseudomonas sp. OIL-1]QIB51989.1 DUF3182 family protein [Pseudomonas sp. OIL-1]